MRLKPLVSAVLSSAVALGVITGASTSAPAAEEMITVNPDGGQGTDDGLAIHYAEGQFQITRKGTGQLYRDYLLPPSPYMFNQLGMSVGRPGEPITAFTPKAVINSSRLHSSNTTTVLPWSVETDAREDGFTAILTGRADDRTYTVTLEATYVAPEDFFQLDYTVDIPEGNDEPVRLFHLLDTYLEQNDEGPGFYRTPQCAGPMVGVDRADVGTVEALQYLGGRKWSGYASMDYGNVVFGWPYTADDESRANFGPGWAIDLPDIVDDNPNTDNGIGTSWNFGREPGTYSSTSRLIFSDNIPTDCPTETEFVDPPAFFVSGKPLPITVQVTGYEGLKPTGSAEIRQGDTVLCSGPVDANGRLTCDITLTGESAQIEAVFTGTGNFTDSASEPHTMVSTAAEIAITSISPPKGPITGGDIVTIKGENFAEGATVTIGGVECTSVNVIDAETITCVTGEHKAGVVNVVVTNPDGKSATLKDGYTYLKDAPTPAQKYFNTIQSGSIKKKKAGKRSVLLRGTSKRKKTRVYIYRADKPRSAAKLVRVVRSKKHIWKAANTPMGKRKSAYFCARFNTQRGPWADTIRVPALKPKKAASGIAGEVRIMRCPRIKR